MRLSTLGILALVTVGGCAPELCTRMYEVRGEGDVNFINTVLKNEDAKRHVASVSQVSDDHVATITTTGDAHLQLRRSLNVRVSDQWPYNWRTAD